MTLKNATLIKLKSQDGFWNVKKGESFVGKKYQVDLDSVRDETFFNVTHRKEFTCEVVNVHDGDDWRHMPTELLKIDL